MSEGLGTVRNGRP